MSLCRNRLFCLVSFVTLTVFPAWCQAASRPAAVLLVATLETISVRANTMDISPASFANATGLVTLTTAFAVPADCTTVHLAGRFDADPEPTSAALDLPTAKESGVSGSAIDNGSTARVLRPGEGDVALFSQAAGHTNWPVNRTDNINLQWSPSSRAGSAPGSPSGTVDILVQAL